ncbi:MAG TPA: TfuA-like protein [Polyangiales bacterium]|jgi:hypothetical protein
MTNVVVFVGPTLSIAEARAKLDASYLPPVAQGDVYRAALARPRAIAIIDGYFERLPAVWHKEILWALSRGIHVFGASSMGALRAAELAGFGMVGIGKIFANFHSGLLQDDDEVTVVHGDASTGYAPLSTAMVDVRSSLDRAVSASVISHASAARLCAIAKRCHYSERSYQRLWSDASEAGEQPEMLSRLADFLTEQRVDQKRIDALLLLETIAQLAPQLSEPKQASFRFEHTDAFEQLVRRNDQPLSLEELGRGTVTQVLEELRLLERGYEALRDAALSRALALHVAKQRALASPDAAYRDRVHAFRREHRLFSGEATLQFIEAQGIERAEFEELMQDEVRIDAVRQLSAAEIERQLIGAVRLRGRFGQLEQRAQHKRRLLDRHGYDNPKCEDTQCDPNGLIDWYFRELCDSEAPEDLASFIQARGFRDPNSFLQAVVREYLYRLLAASGDVAPNSEVERFNQ